MGSEKCLQEYRKGAVNGASPLQLVIMLYDGALKFMEGALAAMASQDFEKQNDCLQRAQQVVAELMGSLDLDQGGEIASNLMGIYAFVFEELVTANMQDDPRKIEACISIIGDLRRAWFELLMKLTASAAQELQEAEHGQTGNLEKRRAAA